MLTEEIKKLPYKELLNLTVKLSEKCDYYETRMLDKSEVARRLGMSVSWLDNSQCPRAIKLREIGVRYGRSRTSPIRFPLSRVVALCHEIEVE